MLAAKPMKTKKSGDDLLDTMVYIGAVEDSVPHHDTMGPFKFYHGGRHGTCIKCNKYTNISMVYKPYKDTREVCDECTTDVFDKLLGIDNSTEKLLYSKPK